MPVSRQSFRRVIGDFVQRYQSKSDSISSSSNERSKTDRNSMISSDSISVSQNNQRQTFFLLIDRQSIISFSLSLIRITNVCIKLNVTFVNHWIISNKFCNIKNSKFSPTSSRRWSKMHWKSIKFYKPFFNINPKLFGSSIDRSNDGNSFWHVLFVEFIFWHMFIRS